MKRLLIATPLYPPDIGGPATFTKILEVEARNHGFEVEVVKYSDVRTLPPIISHAIFALHVYRKLRSCKSVLALDPLGIGLPALISAKISGKPFFLRIVGDRAWETFMSKQNLGSKDNFISIQEFQNGKYGLGVRIRSAIQRYVARSAEKVIVPSNFLKTIVLKWGIKEERVQVIHNSFEVIQTRQTREKARNGLQMGGHIIVSAGRLVAWKGFGALIDVFADIAEKDKTAKLFIIGEGPENGNLEKKIHDFGLQGRVVLLGVLTQEELYRYILGSDVFVLNTLYEGLSHQLLEVMSLGTPIVTTRVGGNVELTGNGKSAFLVECGDRERLKDAIIQMFQHREFAEKFSIAGRERAKDFNRQTMVNNIKNFLSL